LPERRPTVSAVRTATTVRACALGALLSVLAAPGASASLEHPALPGRLSDEVSLTRWTTAVTQVDAHMRPDARSPRVSRLRFYTEDLLPEVYVGLEQARGADRRRWIRVRLPMRPNGTTGWVRREALGSWHLNRSLLHVDRRARTAVLVRRGRVVWRSRVGIGRPGTATPAGRFYVRERIPNLAGNPLYGPIAFGTSAYSRLSDWPGGGVIGVHGTDEPQLIPGRISHGCVRVPNGAIRRLARLIAVGTPVHITDRPLRRTVHSLLHPAPLVES
jgi:hypothetical protein